MASLNTYYLGVNLKNPIIVASSGLTNNIDSITKLIDAGVGAIVLKSLFEEQLLYNASQAEHLNNYDYPEAYDYIRNYTKQNDISNYLLLIEQAKSKYPDVPIIASINCITLGEWIQFAKDIEKAGADALELNIMIISTDPKKSSKDHENVMLEIIQQVRQNTKLPIAVKISSHSLGLAHFIKNIEWTGAAQAIVMFNRQYQIDLDINNLKITSSNIFSNQSDYTESLRWVAIMSDLIKMDIAATTGIWDSSTIIKQILAGAKAVQIASVLYKKGFGVVKTMLSEIENWMNQHNYKTIEDFRGKLSMKNSSLPEAFERIQFMRYFSHIE